MENLKIIILLISIIFLSHCNNKIKSKEKGYIPIFKNILYINNAGDIFIKTKDNKFTSDIAILNDNHILKIKNIIDLKTFHRLRNTSCYYCDKKRVYALQSDMKASYPKFIEINIDKNRLIVIDSVTIRDDSIKCIEGFCYAINKYTK